VIKTNGGVAAYFKSEIKNLHPGLLYAYRVGNEGNWSDWNQFRTRCPGDSAFSLLYIGDIQDSINGKTGEVFRKAWNTDPKAEMVIFIGDMIERPHDEYWKEWFRAGGELFRTVPIIATPGNHEYYKELIQQIDPRWTGHFDFPQNGPKQFLGRVCYWDYGNTRFISMDTNGLNLLTALTQRNWLKKTLENTSSRWKVVMMHHPAFTTSRTHDNFRIE
jgi:phosphodiesterase/alkaline phosphatase D-like protein